MPEFELVRTHMDGAKRFVGTSQDDQRHYEKLQARMRDMQPGEYLKLKVSYPRSLPFHRKFMKMVRFAFQQWEPEKERKRLTYKGVPIEKSFDTFRDEIVIQAGYYVATYDSRGRVHLAAQSLAFENMEDDTFAKVYGAVFEVLWKRFFEHKGYTREELERVLAEFEHFQPT